MRIVGGTNRGRNIIAPSGRSTRPTSDQARESVFNILAHAEWAPPLEGAIVADIFAGSGALGLEALSRGAGYCLFVETEPRAREAIRANIAAHRVEDRARLHRFDARKLKVAPGNWRGPFTHVFLDPPYGRGLWSPVLQRLAAQELLANDHCIILEVGRDDDIESLRMDVRDTRDWGAAKVLFGRMKPEGDDRKMESV